MGVKRRLTGYSGMRVDWPHIRSIESAISFDFDSVLRGMITGLDKPYLIRGFEIRIPDAAVSANSLQVEISDSVILHSTAGESGTIFTIPNGTAAEALNSSNPKVVGAFQNGVPNYVGLELVRVTDPDSADQTAGWSEAQKTEFQRTVPIGVILDYRYVITTSGFSTNLPLYVIGVSPTGATEYIQNSRDNLFRLGKGGTVPDPFSSFNFGAIENEQDTLSPRREWINENPGVNPNPVVVVPGDDEAAFRFGDFSIRSLKDWMDAIMTRFKEITGSSYWYTDSTLLGKSINTFDLWWDSIGSVMTGAGNISYNLILEIPGITSGAIQTKFLDNTVLSGDSYVEGATSGNKANLQAINTTQLVVNSLIREDFIYDEVLRNRRIWRPNLAVFEIDDDVDLVNLDRIALVKRKPTAIAATPIGVASWSYTGNVITINTLAPHGLEVGDNALVSQLELSVETVGVPNGVHLVKEVPSTTQFIYTAQVEPTGAPVTTGSSTIFLDNPERHPFLPRYAIKEWEYAGTDIFLTIEDHGFVNGDDIVVSGLVASTDAPNGRFLGVTVEPDRRIKYTAGAAPTGTATVTVNSFLRYDRYDFLLTISGASPDTYEATNVLATAWSDTQLSYVIGPNTFPAQPTASGAIVLDGVVAVSSVANPVKVLRVENNGSGELLVTTNAVHNYFTNPGPIDFTIYGDQSISPYIRTYSDMSINTVTRTVNTIEKNGISAVVLLSVLVNTFDGGEIITINGVDFTEGVDWSVGGTDILTAGNIATAINGYGPFSGVISATDNLDGSVTLTADVVGVAGNAIVVSISNEGATTNLQFNSDTFFGGFSYLEVITDTAHGFYAGNVLTISGSGAPENFNGTFTISSILGANTFRVDFGGNGVAGTQAGGSVINLSQFKLIPIAPNGTVILPPPSSYVNSTNADVFARSPNNPYPGPVQWDADIQVKGIIGDRYFIIPQSATAEGTAVADKFNINGLTGTAFLQDGEVAYIELERNKLVSAGVTYTTSGTDVIIGAVPPIDENNAPLQAGDFVKFESDSESRWLRIKGTVGTDILTNSFQLESDNGQQPSAIQRPNATGRLLYSKTVYPVITVKPHYLVSPNPDIYWIAVRRDNGSSKSKVYFRSLELEQGEVRQTNDNEMSNLLVYTGAGTEAAINPNYTVIDANGPYGPTQTLVVGSNVEDIDINTRMITFIEGPELGFEAEDKITFTHPITSLPVTYTVNFLISSRTVVVKEDIADLQLGQDVTFIRTNYKINDTDNLTFTARKMNRESARINTSLERPIYDESAYIVQMNMNGAGTVKSGSFIYQGTADNPSALAWVLHGNDTVVETIESFGQGMPGGHPSIGANAILIHVYSGTWLDGSAIYQAGANTGRTVNNSGDPEFTSPEIAGGVNGVEIVLPPNRRTQVTGSAIIIWPTYCTYKASLDPILAGEELMVIANDSIRQATVDYDETFGGPKGKIKFIRSLPPKTRLRFRILPAFGSALAKLAGNVTLQLAYDGGRIISTIAGLPVDIRAGDAGTGGTGLALRGSMEINGEGAIPGDIIGGIFGPRTPVNQDQAFVIGKESNKPKEVWAGSDFIKTHTGYTGSAWVRKTASGVSTGASSFVISTTAINVTPGKSARVAMNATARRTDGPLGIASFRIEATFYNTGAGVQVAGSPTTMHYGGAGDGDQYAVSFGVLGDDVVLVVFGTTGSTIQWVTGIDYQILEGSA